ncbi:MAG: alpha/beta hydrolase [Planctomycetota bacterium]|jgi:fermentation-respiration switch protein FrsA (DUF1100 family)
MVVKLLLALGGIWVLLAGLVYLFQRRLQYLPDTSEVGPPRAGIEDVALHTSDGVALRAWYWPGTRELTLVFFHGNAGHRGDRLEWLEPFHQLGWGLFLLDYRGYGGSRGSPTEEGLYRDAEAAVDYLHGRGVARLVYFGESLGCGVAVEAAVRRPPVALILQAGAASLVGVARKAYPWLPVGLLMKDRFDAAARIPRVRCPVLCVHGSRDELIPVALGRALYDAAPEPKEWFELSDAGHNDLPWTGGRAYYERIHTFLEQR